MGTKKQRLRFDKTNDKHPRHNPTLTNTHRHIHTYAAFLTFLETFWFRCHGHWEYNARENLEKTSDTRPLHTRPLPSPDAHIIIPIFVATHKKTLKTFFWTCHRQRKGLAKPTKNAHAHAIPSRRTGMDIEKVTRKVLQRQRYAPNCKPTSTFTRHAHTPLLSDSIFFWFHV